MKKLLSTSCLCAFAATAIPAFAQDDSTPPPPPPAPPALREDGGKGQGDRPFSPEDREKLRVARDKAMQDESVKAAREKMRAASEEFRKVLRPALLAQDASLGPILDKMEKAEKERIEKSEPGAGRPAGERPAGPMGVLTKEEREKLDAAREKVKDNAEVKAAREKQNVAAREFGEVLRMAMIAADPSVEPMINKMMQMRGRVGGPQGPGGGQRNPDGAGNPPPK